MNDPKQLFTEVFCNSNNNETAVRYLASLMSQTEDAEEYRIKMRQVSLLQDFFESNLCSDREYYLQKLRDVKAILERDCIANAWEMPSENCD